jgi:ABC-2 type transport system ATP-binding protein
VAVYIIMSIRQKAEPNIQLEDVSICYRVPFERIPSIKEYAIRWLRQKMSYNHFWALKNLNLKIYQGEVLGIIGSNGAGKSTLLKVIARVLHPTQGRVRIKGRVAPLLELGAGFDFELTGRENIVLNGTILGFTRQDIVSRLNRIVDFAGLQHFINAPLRTYSTGMIARLGFSVATDVQPEILLVDEVLAVGDAEFQEKCTERINAFRQSGTTILLVSHGLDAVENICERLAWLSQGELKVIGSPQEIISLYRKKDAQEC